MGLFDKLFGGGKKNINFTSTDELLEDERFWEIILTTKNNSGQDFEKQQQLLATELHKLSPTDIIRFENRFCFYKDKSNTWELWGAIYLIHGGCSDDSFNDFREWVIGQGKDFYFTTIADPETLVEVDTNRIEGSEWEGLGYVAATVFEKVTGQEIPHSNREYSETTGQEWDEESDDLKKMFPKLYAKYSANI